ncbi:endonuclease [Solemya pervernicosa gill symbiont]|uniref:Endonuclease n=2 Tax=Gammaproteobacteria incertae sedis TaxID=118884 RepID=A0A1T2L4I7_9GAMM|nr:endonuclease/exonuclease/phosphatase family protein [Candidatus Reidiella endopervernicosa]OOZ40017.1 endonuclease [Solemya pervernicosa gill symbiont]QKQ25300.1 endonuclease/exonuclease/phosphatase family protein [Candidatus Reidiella endopervernicosa]
MNSGSVAVAQQPVERIGHDRPLRLLSYNIQAGITTRNYHNYITHSWKHLLPHSERMDNLARVAQLASEFDIAGLQEVDSGSLRSGFINQTEYIAHRGHIPHWYDKTNRNLGKLAQHSIGMLSQIKPTHVSEHKLPGVIPGRGVLKVEFGGKDDPLVVIIIHLALGKRARMRQLDFISELVSSYRHVILMGDLNCVSESEEIRMLSSKTDLHEPVHGLHTFPSWRPEKNIDHILVSPTLKVCKIGVLKYPFSDHLPIAMELRLPKGLYIDE